MTNNQLRQAERAYEFMRWQRENSEPAVASGDIVRRCGNCSAWQKGRCVRLEQQILIVVSGSAKIETTCDFWCALHTPNVPDQATAKGKL